MQWLVLLEAERGLDADPIGVSDMRRLLGALADPAPGALHSDARYAVQVEVDGASPSEAVSAAVSQWEGAVRQLGLPRWELVRAEALTRSEFEQEFLDYEEATGPDGSRTSSSDAGHRRGVEEALLRRAFHDPLTDLASQSLFRDHLERALAGGRAVDASFALLLVDIDCFAGVNQRLGRPLADSVLLLVAQRIVTAVRHPGKVGRMGGDQFAVLLQVLSAEEARATAERIVETFAAPVLVEGVEVRVTVSVGVALEEVGDASEDLLYRATRAVRAAQDRGGDRFEVFSPEMVDVDVDRLIAERNTVDVSDTSSSLALVERLALGVEGCSTLEDAAFVVLRQFCDHTGFPVGRVYMLGEEADPPPARIWVAGEPGRFGPFREIAWAHRLRPGEGVAGRALEQGGPVWVRDISSEPELSMPHEVVAAGLRGALALSVVVNGRSLAVLEFFAAQALEYGDALLQVLTTVGAHLAAVARRAESERARARAERRLRVLVENSGIHVKILGPDGRVRAQYPAQWAEDAVVPLSAVDFVHPDDLAVATRGWAEALQSPGPRPPFECRVRQPDGSWRWGEITVNNMLDVAEVGGVVTYCKLIDDRKRWEEAWRRSEARVRQAQAVARVGTWSADLVTGHVEWSDERYRILNVEPGGATPTFATLLEAVHPDDRAALEEQRRLLHTGGRTQVEFRVIGPDGAIRWISSHASAVCDGTGRVVALEGSDHDITERKQLERALREAEERLERLGALAPTESLDHAGLDEGRAGSETSGVWTAAR